MTLKKTKAHEFAKTLYLDRNQNLTNKEIAKRVGVTEKTIGNWIRKFNWKELRKSLLVTRKEMISDLYDQLEILNYNIKTRDIVYDSPEKLPKGKKPEDYPILIGNFPTSKEANTQIAITNNIKKLETETSIGEIYEVGTAFCEFIKPIDFDLHLKVVGLFDLFIQEKLG